ncbi:hypothetical protein AYK25_01280 [Thermoplasmatales archaeon SM1-50]|nr:MAG: hypothetical protein AYK25_01280 [Thermoplasmatales archaeon SM1-50]
MLGEEEVPHERRKDCLLLWFFLFNGMGCGKRRGEMTQLSVLCKGGKLPQADVWMGMYCHRFLRGEFMFLSLHHFAMHFCLAIPE